MHIEDLANDHGMISLRRPNGLTKHNGKIDVGFMPL